MRLLPQYLDTRDSDAQIGTSRVRAVEPLWLAALDRRVNEYVVWGPNFQSGGWGPVWYVDRRPTDKRPDWDAFVIAQQLARRSEQSVEQRRRQRHEANRRLRERQREAELAVGREKLGYGRKAVAAEYDGGSRFSKEDVINGLRMADEGRTKAPPKGQVFSLPGEGQKVVTK